MEVKIEKPNNIYGFMVTGTGLVLGKPMLDKESNLVEIKNPRLARVIQTQGGNDLACVPIVGEPDSLRFVQNPLYIYEVKDKRVLNKYTESVSGIQVINQMPPISFGK